MKQAKLKINKNGRGAILYIGGIVCRFKWNKKRNAYDIIFNNEEEEKKFYSSLFNCAYLEILLNYLIEYCAILERAERYRKRAEYSLSLVVLE